jgi:hypothetical protein
MLLLAAAAPAWAVPPSEELLPGTTKGFLCVSNVDQLNRQWSKTQLGKLMADPVMDPFLKDLRRQFDDRFSDLRDHLGLTLDDVRGVPAGELSVATIAPAPEQSANVLLMDVSGRVDKAKAMIATAVRNMVRRGAVQTREETASALAVVLEIPKPANDPEGEARTTIYFLSGNVVGVTDHRAVAASILARLAGQPGDTLAKQAAFREVMARCKKDAGPTAPLIRWYIQPLGYAEAIRAATPEHNRRKGKTVIQIMRNQGFDAIQGLGGFVDLKLNGYEVVHRTAIYAPKPWQKSMKMLIFPNGKDFAPQPWVPRNVATYATLYLDIQNAFDNFGPMFDELMGEKGETGIWNEIVQGLKDDPNGPRIDLRRELIALLGRRVTLLSDYQLPITTTSERLLCAIETSNEKGVAAAIEKWMRGDQTAKRRVWKGRTIWEMIEPEEQDLPKIDMSAIPGVGPPEPPAKHPAGKHGKDSGEEEQEVRLLPHAAVTVAYGHLLIASHMDFLLKILTETPEQNRLVKSPDYQRLQNVLKQESTGEHCLETFSRTDEEYRATYELIKQGKMPQSETTLGRLLNGIMGPPKKGTVRKQRISGAQMPDFEIVRRALGPAGLTSVMESSDWFVKGYGLPREEKPARLVIEIKPGKPATKVEKPAVKPTKPAIKSDKPAVKPAKPATKPDKPAVKPDKPQPAPKGTSTLPNAKQPETAKPDPSGK